MASSNKHVISLGGSILNPAGIDEKFLEKFSIMVKKRISAGDSFAIFTGGGSLARKFQTIARENKGSEKTLDSLGIEATRINARALAHTLGVTEEIITIPNKKIRFKGGFVGGGWKPGASTDHCAVSFAIANGVKTVVNISNTNFVYEADPKKVPKARALKELTWSKMKDLVGTKWTPGLNMPFDPIATKLASQKNLRVVFLGPSVKNIALYLKTGRFRGSIIDGKS